MPLIDGTRVFNIHKVTLTDDELRLAASIADRRNGTQTRAGVRSRRFGDLSDADTHLAGARAELAAARILGLRVNERAIIGGNKRGDDLRTPGGASIDVRFRAERGRALASKTVDGSDMRADLFVLVWPGLSFETAIGLPSPHNDPPHTYETVGWITRSLWQRWAETAHLRADRMEVDAARLLWMDDLIERLDAERAAVLALTIDRTGE